MGVAINFKCTKKNSLFSKGLSYEMTICLAQETLDPASAARYSLPTGFSGLAAKQNMALLDGRI